MLGQSTGELLRPSRMAPRLPAVLCLAALVQLLLGVQILADPLKETPIRLSVVSDVSNEAPQVYHTSALAGGLLLGALRRLQDTSSDFKFTVTEDPDFGYYLESVNGVAGSKSDYTYWQILADINGDLIPIDVGIGCYTPKAYEHITLKLTTW